MSTVSRVSPYNPDDAPTIVVEGIVDPEFLGKEHTAAVASWARKEARKAGYKVADGFVVTHYGEVTEVRFSERLDVEPERAEPRETLGL